MTHLIASGRVFLRPFEPSDAALYQRWRSDAETMRLASYGPPLGLAQVERRIDQLTRDQGTEQYAFLICLTDDGRPIGEASLFDLDLANGSAQLGIFIGDAADRGLGYGTDAVTALVDFGIGELRLERIWLEVWTENASARRSYEKAGFVHEGTIRNDRFEGGAHTSGDIMSVLAEEWRARRSASPHS